jgi:hypothetical protein
MTGKSAGKMKNNKVVSLRRYRAHRVYGYYTSLPSTQRTQSRSTVVLEAIFDYAYEHVPDQKWGVSRRIRVSPEESRRISSRLEEFILPVRQPDTDPIMRWLHDNMIEEAWENPEDLGHFVGECIKDC